VAKKVKSRTNKNPDVSKLISIESFKGINVEFSNLVINKDDTLEDEYLKLELSFEVYPKSFDKKLIEIFIHSRLLYEIDENEEYLSIFHIDTMSEFRLNQNNLISEKTNTIKTNILEIMLSISYSTTRGYVAGILENNPNVRSPLPIINPKVLLNSNSDRIMKNGNYNFDESTHQEEVDRKLDLVRNKRITAPNTTPKKNKKA